MLLTRSQEVNGHTVASGSAPITSPGFDPRIAGTKATSKRAAQKRRRAPASNHLRAEDKDKDGEDDSAGVVLPLTYVGSSAFDASYTMPILVGSTRQKMYVQVDSGSADLWLASTACSDSSCPSARRRSLSPNSAPHWPAYKHAFSPLLPRDTGSDTSLAKRINSPLYNPSSSTTRIETGTPIAIEYLVGNVQGLMIWDSIGLDLSDAIDGGDDGATAPPDADGSYPWTVSSQAFASASALVSEPLRPNYSGVMGIGPPANSLISGLIPATEDGNVDGATWTSNIWSSAGNGNGSTLTEHDWYMRLLLDRPDGGVLGAPQAILTLGAVPSSSSYPKHYQDGESGSLGTMYYTRPLASLDATTHQVLGTTFWRVQLVSLSVSGKPITLPSPSGTTAILDSGVPTILATKSIADGIYGAIGVGPGGDGNYYLPCDTMLPLNVTLRMTLGGGDLTFPVHPLDTAERRAGKNECMGTIQASAALAEGDVILGVAFLRSVETVFGFDGQVGVNGNGGSGGVKLGLRSLIDLGVAQSEWETVRVDGTALTGGGGSSSKGTSTSASDSHGISKVGVVALAVIGSLLGVCVLMFGVWRWMSIRRDKLERGLYETTNLRSPTAAFHRPPPPPPPEKSYLFGLIKIKQTPEEVERRRTSAWEGYAMEERTEDEKRKERFDAYMARQQRTASEYSEFGVVGPTHERDRTLVASMSTYAGKDVGVHSEDSGEEVFTGQGKADPWDPATALDWGGRGGERDVLLSTEGAETKGEAEVPRT